MKIFGPGIFENDVTQKVRDEFTKSVADGKSVYAAADQILNRVVSPLVDSERPQVFLALAALQLEHGLIQPKIKKNALTVIILNEDDENWLSAPPETVAARKKILQDLRRKLTETMSGIG